MKLHNDDMPQQENEVITIIIIVSSCVIVVNIIHYHNRHRIYTASIVTEIGIIVCTYIHAYIHTYIHTHTHVNASSRNGRFFTLHHYREKLLLWYSTLQFYNNNTV